MTQRGFARALTVVALAAAGSLAAAGACTVDATGGDEPDAAATAGADADVPRGPDAGDDDCPTVRVTTEQSNLNVREQPNTDSDIVGSLPRDAVVEVLDRVEGEEVLGESEWFHIEDGATIGYVSGAFAECTTGE